MSAGGPQSGQNRILLIILAAVAGLTAVFGLTSLRSSHRFSEYREQTVGASPIWTQRELSVEECLVHAIDWGTQCPGIQSWCEAEVPRVASQCLQSQDRTAYCEQVGDAILTTGFGFHECEAMREAVEGKYAKRWHKKYCARSWRAVADHCRDLRGD